MERNKISLKDKLSIITTVYSIISTIALIVAVVTFCIWRNETVICVCLIVLIVCLFEQNHITGFMKGCKYQKALDDKKED